MQTCVLQKDKTLLALLYDLGSCFLTLLTSVSTGHDNWASRANKSKPLILRSFFFVGCMQDCYPTTLFKPEIVLLRLSWFCISWDFFTFFPFKGQKTPNPQFCGVNRRFQAKSKIHAYYQNYCIDSNQTVIKTTLRGWSQHTNPWWPMATILQKLKNSHISAAVPAISTKFGTVTQFDPLVCFDR